MKYQLTAHEARVIGCLLEKQVTTPEQYPLSVNAVVTACNQKTNREPVMSLSESEVQALLDTLVKRHYLRTVSGFGNRVTKYEQRFCNSEFGDLKLSAGEVAVVTTLLLRGAQTPGELRSRAQRMYEFSDMAEVESVLEGLTTREDGPFVARLPREPGKRESRYMHLFCDDMDTLITTVEALAPLDDDGDLMAWTAGTEAAPGYYDISLRTLTEYQLEEIREKELLQYKNGKAVLKSILRQVGSDSGKIQILSGENDRIHVNLSDAEGSWYETWKVENDRLVLTDSGEGSVKEVHESGDVSGQNAVSQNSAVSDREADSISENNATGSIGTRSVTKSGQKSENGTESHAFDFSAPDGTAKETQTEQE